MSVLLCPVNSIQAAEILELYAEKHLYVSVQFINMVFFRWANPLRPAGQRKKDPLWMDTI